MTPAKRAQYIADGLCSNGCRRSLRTRTVCGVCADNMKLTTVMLQHTYMMHGLCRNGCGRDLVTKQYCRECADRANGYARRWRQKR